MHELETYLFCSVSSLPSLLLRRFAGRRLPSFLSPFRRGGGGGAAAVMVISRLWLRAQYNREHLTGVALCLTGLALIIVSDMGGDEQAAGEEPAAYPHALWGDVICAVGAVLYACSNVMQEDFVKNHDRVSFRKILGKS